MRSVAVLRVIPLFAALAALLCLASASAALAKPRVLTTFTVIADIARNVAGDNAEVVSVTRPGAEIHGYQPTPRDLLRARGADLVLWNGLNLERWFEKFLQRLDHVPAVVVSEGIEPIGIGEGAYSGKPNPHAWMSPDGIGIYVENIRVALTELDPANADSYAANAADYLQRIEAALTPLRERLATIPDAHRWLVTSEGAFSYLARDLKLRELYLWPINADSQGTPLQVRKVIDAVREHGIPVIFSESTVSDKPARQIARETGARYGGVLFVDSLSKPDGPVPTYIDLLRVTIETIVEGLSQ